MKPSAHPLWLVGFRPFFTLACLAGMSLPTLWVLVLVGTLPAPAARFTPVQWHAHEMFFGFGWAVLAGFLLTSTKNWVQVRGYHGRPLMFLVAAWSFERAGMWFGGQWPLAVFELSNNLFLGSVVAMLAWTLLRNRKRDTYPDNLLFIVILPAFLVAKRLMLSPSAFQLGWGMALGLFRMAFLVMLERTLTQFMKAIFQVSILRDARLDLAIKALGLTLVFAGLLPPQVSSWLALALAALLTFRFCFWKPQLGLRRLDLGIMYLGYLALVAQLVVAFLGQFSRPVWIGAVLVHTFAFGVMGLIIPAMLIRIAKGHTGRKVTFDAFDKLALWVMLAAFVFRLVLPQLSPDGYTLWLSLAAACWFVCFATIAWRHIPMLMQPRVDGREH